jgi:DNA-binding NtrC family response regulator
MTRTIVVLGDLPVQRQPLAALAEQFGWTIQQSPDVCHLRTLNREQSVVAVLFDPKSVGAAWQDGLRAVREAAPRARRIVCCGFANAAPWHDMAAAGAFDVLNLPLAWSEVRQSFGFVWADSETRGPKAIFRATA